MSQAGLQTYAFLVFAVVCVLGAGYLYAVLPETKNKTFVDISRSFAKMNKVECPADTQELELVVGLSLPATLSHESTNGKASEMESSF